MTNIQLALIGTMIFCGGLTLPLLLWAYSIWKGDISLSIPNDIPINPTVLESIEETK